MYEDRPDGCREFECAWLQMERAGIEMRPDRCGVVFEKLSDDVMGGVTDGYMTYLVRGQVDAFNREGLSVVIFDHSTRRKACFLAEGHTIEFVEAEIHGGAKLY
jgi:hypothetical protein